MATSNSKQRLFEVMGKTDKTFTTKLKEDFFRGMSPSPFGGTKNAEYRRSIQLFEEIFKTKGVYYALAFLYDSQYGNEDLKNMMELIKPQSGSNRSATKENPEQPVNEKMIGKKPTRKSDDVSYYKGSGIFPGYTHFAFIKADTPYEGGVLKTANKIVNGWDYRGEDSEDLKVDKRAYFTNDIIDMEIKPKLVGIVTAGYLKKRGIDPYDQNNWLGGEDYSNFIKAQY